jgi:hypothetical protein
MFLYNQATGNWKLLGATPGAYANVAGGLWGTNWTIWPADFDGNALADLFLYNALTGQFFKAINRGNGNFDFFGYRWAPGWTPVVADFNGDGLSDVFLYTRSPDDISCA